MPSRTEPCSHPEDAQTILFDRSTGSTSAVCRLCTARRKYRCLHTQLIGNQRVSVIKAGGQIEECMQCHATWIIGEAPKPDLSAPV